MPGFVLQIKIKKGAWVAQSVKCPCLGSARVIISGSWDWALHRALRLAWSLLQILPLSPSHCPSYSFSLKKHEIIIIKKDEHKLLQFWWNHETLTNLIPLFYLQGSWGPQRGKTGLDPHGKAVVKLGSKYPAPRSLGHQVCSSSEPNPGRQVHLGSCGEHGVPSSSGQGQEERPEPVIRRISSASHCCHNEAFCKYHVNNWIKSRGWYSLIVWGSVGFPCVYVCCFS